MDDQNMVRTIGKSSFRIRKEVQISEDRMDFWKDMITFIPVAAIGVVFVVLTTLVAVHQAYGIR